MYNKILVPLDGSRLAECVLEHVKAIAGGCVVREVILFRVCEPLSILADYPADMPDKWENHVKDVEEFNHQQCNIYLHEIENKLAKSGVSGVKSISCLGDAATQITDYAVKNDIDLIIISSHGRSGVSRWPSGSVADKVFHSSSVPVLMVKPPNCGTI